MCPMLEEKVWVSEWVRNILETFDTSTSKNLMVCKRTSRRLCDAGTATHYKLRVILQISSFFHQAFFLTFFHFFCCWHFWLFWHFWFFCCWNFWFFFTFVKLFFYFFKTYLKLFFKPFFKLIFDFLLHILPQIASIAIHPHHDVFCT